MRKPSAKLILRVGVLLVLAVACLISASALDNTLQSQYMAERWAGESDTKFVQISCFMPPDNGLDINRIYEFRQKLEEKLREAMPEAESVEGLYCDCWSGKGSIRLSGDRGSGEMSVITVGGSFFDFHPIKLLSGSYITERDIMKDRVILDEDSSWMLFGGTDLQSMTVNYGDVPYLVSGVISRESDFASSRTYDGGPGAFMSYDAYLAIDKDSDILNYEIVIAEPVEDFAINTFKELFPNEGCEIVQNSGRYSFINGIKQVFKFGTRSMHSNNVAYPYWENAARYIEDWCALLSFAAAVLLIMPIIVVIIYLVRLILLGRDKLKATIPALAEKAADKAQDTMYRRRRVRSGRAGKERGK